MAEFTNWPPATSSGSAATCCWWDRPASAKAIWPRPSAPRPSKPGSSSSTAPCSTWCANSWKSNPAGESRLLARYLKPDLLIIDDMGLKILPAKSGEILFEIIMRRYENRSTMMTSNRPIEEWGKLLGDVPAASAILDRLLHHAELIPITGRSYRLQPNAKQPLTKK